MAALLLAAGVAALMVLRPGPSGRNTPGSPSSPHASSLPARVLSGYWQAWGSPDITLGAVPAQYNVVFAAFAVADGPGSGRVRFDQHVQSEASFVADVDALQRTGRRVVLSVGGADDGGLEIRTPAQIRVFFASVTRLVDRYHFTGLDWDLEHGFDRQALTRLSRELKARYGPRFLITMAPLQNQPDYQALATDLSDVLDLVSPQFYNTGRLSRDDVVGQVRAWADRVGADRVGMGFMTVPSAGDTGIVSPAEVVATWQQVVHLYPGARGVMTWSINLDATSGYRLARTCGPVVRGAD